MKNKPFLLIMLLLISRLSTITAYAGVDLETNVPPSIAVWLDGGLLRVQADEGSGVSAVYINSKKLDYPEDGLSVNAAEYAQDNGKLAVYAADDSGNVSNTVTLYLQSDTSEPTPISKPFTPDGSGTVVDNAANGGGKEFYTFKTPKDNVFYLIIDRQRGSENVYLLNQVTEQDLMALAEEENKGQIITPSPIPTPSPSPAPSPSPEPTQTQAPPDEQINNGFNPALIILPILAGIGIALGYYFKVIRPKNRNTVYDSSLLESGDSENDNGFGEGFNYNDDEIPYDRDDDWDD